MFVECQGGGGLDKMQLFLQPTFGGFWQLAQFDGFGSWRQLQGKPFIGNPEKNKEFTENCRNLTKTLDENIIELLAEVNN